MHSSKQDTAAQRDPPGTVPPLCCYVAPSAATFGGNGGGVRVGTAVGNGNGGAAVAAAVPLVPSLLLPSVGDRSAARSSDRAAAKSRGKE